MKDINKLHFLSIGVIITVYNKEKWVKRALESVLNQTELPEQVIVINDCSTDNSEEIIKQLIPEFSNKCNFTYISLEQNTGAAEARNIAISNLKTDFATFLDADDYYANNHIEILKQLISVDVGLIACSVKKEKSNHIYPSTKLIKTFKCKGDIYEITDCYKSLSKESFFIGGGNVCFKLSIANNIILKKGEQNFEEWDFYYQLLKNAYQKRLIILFSPIIGLYYNDIDESSLSRKVIEDPTTITVPMLIKRLSSEHELGFKKFVISLWIYNSLTRLKSFDQKVTFLKLQKVFVRQLPFNRYSIGSLLNIFTPTKILSILSNYIKNRRLKK